MENRSEGVQEDPTSVASFLRKLKHPLLILAVAALLSGMIQTVKIPGPLVWPTWWYNLDSALYYIVFYAIGYVAFPCVNRALNPRTRKGKLLLVGSVAVSFAYAVLVYLNRDPLANVENLRYTLVVHPLLRALIIIWVYFAAAKWLENQMLMQKLGSNTLYLCGGEFIVKSLPASVLTLVGINLYPQTLPASLLHSAGMLLLAMVTVVPLEKWLLQKLEAGITALLPRKTPAVK